jgi:hypothetical protein
MSLDFYDREKDCPMCGARQPVDAQRCSECGEWISEERLESLGNIDVQKVKRFRREIHGLAGFWIFFGVLSGVVGIVLLTVDENIFPGRIDPDLQTFVGGVTLLVGAIWFASGFASAYKQLWGVYVGLTVTYINLAGNLINTNVCGIIISIIVIIQAHRVLKISRELRNAGVPLTCKPR